MGLELDIHAIRRQFPALERRQDGQPVAYFDGPGGSQVPLVVADAVRRHLLHSNANAHGLFASSVESEAVVDEARRAAADFVGAQDAREVAWGPNTTTQIFALSRSLSREWSAGDEVILSGLDHDANVAPWIMAAQDAGATVHTVPVRVRDASLDIDALGQLLSARTRLVAVTAASNATGTLTPIEEIAQQVHAVEAELFVDAAHYAPHRAIDVAAWDCDYLACSTYKFFGPHLGMLWGRGDRMRELHAYQVRPARAEMPGRFEIGTLNREGIAGTLAAIEYLAELGRGAGGVSAQAPRRLALLAAYEGIRAHESRLCERLLRGLAELQSYRVWGVSELDRMADRVPTVAITHAARSAASLAAELGERGLFVGHGNFYSLELCRALGREPDGMLRIGLLHYNTAEEIDRLLAALAELSSD